MTNVAVNPEVARAESTEHERYSLEVANNFLDQFGQLRPNRFGEMVVAHSWTDLAAGYACELSRGFQQGGECDGEPNGFVSLDLSRNQTVVASFDLSGMNCFPVAPLPDNDMIGKDSASRAERIGRAVQAESDRMTASGDAQLLGRRTLTICYRLVKGRNKFKA